MAQEPRGFLASSKQTNKTKYGNPTVTLGKNRTELSLENERDTNTTAKITHNGNGATQTTADARDTRERQYGTTNAKGISAIGFAVARRGRIGISGADQCNTLESTWTDSNDNVNLGLSPSLASHRVG